MNESLRSICCNAPMEVQGDTTLHYVCEACGKAADPKSERNTMNWTKTPPTKSGAYWFRPDTKAVPTLMEIYVGNAIFVGETHLMAYGKHWHDGVNDMTGEWCGPLVPVEEVTHAFYEGAQAGRDNEFRDIDTIYNSYSRAGRVVEGVE